MIKSIENLFRTFPPSWSTVSSGLELLSPDIFFQNPPDPTGIFLLQMFFHHPPVAIFPLSNLPPQFPMHSPHLLPVPQLKNPPFVLECLYIRSDPWFIASKKSYSVGGYGVVYIEINIICDASGETVIVLPMIVTEHIPYLASKQSIRVSTDSSDQIFLVWVAASSLCTRGSYMGRQCTKSRSIFPR